MLRNSVLSLALLRALRLPYTPLFPSRRSTTGSRSFFLQRYDVFVQPDIVRILSDKAAIDLQAFLRVPLRDVVLGQHLTIGDVPGALQRQRASCAGYLTGGMLRNSRPSLAHARSLV